MKHGVVLTCALAGCGRIAFDPLGRASDAAVVGDTASDALGPCVQWGPFGTPTRIPELGSPTDDWGPYATPDQLSFYLFSARTGTAGGFDLWTSSRPDVMSMWSTPVAVPNVNTASLERSPWLTSDGLTLGFSSDRPGTMGGLDMWWTTRPDLASAWGTPTQIPNVNSSADELNSELSANGLRLYMSTARGSSLDIYVAERATVMDSFAAPVPIAELNAPGVERDITLSSDELEVFLITDRAGLGDDVFHATRPDLASPFSTPVRVPELSTPMDDVGVNLSRDGQTMYWNYNAVSAGGNSEVYTATRACLAH